MASFVPQHDRQPFYASLPTPPRDLAPPSPRYAEPDLDPSEIYPWTREALTMSESTEHHGNGNGPETSLESSGAGPSRKRPRQEDEERTMVQQSRQRRPMPIAPSLFGIDARNDFTATIGDFIINNCRGRDNVEVEIKLGTLTAALGQGDVPRRIKMPSLSELILPSDYPLGPFISSMTKPQNIALNKLLNEATTNSQQSPFPIKFFRAQQTDSFHRTGDKASGKIRVSRYRNSGEIMPGGIIRKKRLADLNVYCPKHVLDWRISVSTEEPCEMPNSPPEGERDKDRACYRHQLVQVDLTVVTTKVNEKSPPSMSYEVEIEILDVPSLLAEAEKDAAGQENRFEQMLLSCLDTARMLIRNV